MALFQDRTKVAALCAIATSLLLHSCSGTTPERAYLDARAQIGHKKSGFQTYRDPEPLLTYAARMARGDQEVQRYNRSLGTYEIDAGRQDEGLKALEKAALAGDVSSGSKVAKAQYSNAYRPADVRQFAQKVYLPLAAQQKDDVTVRLLLARLADTGEVSGAEFKSATYWLESAAALGSHDAVLQLAKMAEQNGNIGLAAQYFARVDKGTPIDRAKKQARDYYLGRDQPQNTFLGHAWMQRLAKSDKMIAGQLAAQIYRASNGAVDNAYLENLAAAAGITNIMGGGKSKLVLAYMAAKTDAERAKVLNPLRQAAKHGDAEASLTLAGVLLEVGGPREEIFQLVEASMKKDSKDAMPMLLKLAALVDAKDSTAPRILAATKAAADHGSADAAKTLSMIYSTGSITSADERQGRYWLKKAADGGDNDAQYQLGVVLWTTAKTDQDRQEARIYLKKSAAAGNAAAVTYLDTIAAEPGVN